ncbi:MAG: serine/threonine-protein kinase [Acidobacteria bacterium]|nr:MAG: serine/threonine-protein kinase [Acidobacteriota bacterium]
MIERGTRLGPYEVESALGAGGMGEVYRARDTRLDRTVALKVLSAKLDATPELRGRFEREARAIAALQHPNICVLHDLGQEGAMAFLVMEYLEGETLAVRLRRGALPLTEVIAIGGQIASALERAHRAGIIHRDLKPANVMLTRGGAKLLDFGLAKANVTSGFAQTAIASDAPTLSAMTQAGVVMGTVPYMAPEQLEGREADARSDIYAFGCVLYEMTTAEAAYKGTHTIQPPALHRLVQACLARNPDVRVQSAHDAGLMLAAAGEAAAPAAVAARRRWLWPAITTAAVIAAAAVAWHLRPAAPAAQISAEIAPPPGTHFAFQGVHPGPPVISPDGRRVVFLASSGNHTSLWLRSLDSPVARELPGTVGADLPFWSPDSREIGFVQSATEVGVVDTGALMVLDLAGGAPRELAPVGTFRGGTWAADGTILYAPDSSGGLMRIRASGGTPQPVLKGTANIDSHRFPYFLPDGKHFLYMTVSHADPTRDMIYEASLDGSMNRPLIASQTPGIYADGALLYSDRGTLLAARLDQASGTLSGSPRPVVTGIYDDVESWRPGYSVSRTGLLVYASGSAGPQRLAWTNRSGVLGPLLPGYSGEAVQASVAPDGAHFALAVDNGIQDIWTQSSTGGTPTRLTFGGPLIHSSPVWSPDGRWIAYSDRATAWRIAATGGARQRIGAGPSGTTFFEPAGWSADGKELLCMLVNERGLNSMAGLNVAGGALRPIAATPGMNIAELELSPDSRWVGYLAGPPGQPENVYLVPFRGGSGSVWQVTTAGASRFFWVKGGRELDVIDETGQLLAIPVTVNGDAPVPGTPQVVATNFPEAIAAAPDGQGFLAVTYPDDHQSLCVLSDWPRTLH